MRSTVVLAVNHHAPAAKKGQRKDVRQRRPVEIEAHTERSSRWSYSCCGVGTLMLLVEDTVEVPEEVLPVVELVPELRVAKSEAASKLRFFHAERTDSIRAGMRREDGVCGCNSLSNCFVVNCEFGSYDGANQPEKRI